MKKPNARMGSEDCRGERKTEPNETRLAPFPASGFSISGIPYSAGLLFFSNLKTCLIHDEDGSADR
jgi:hypothetical protein